MLELNSVSMKFGDGRVLRLPEKIEITRGEAFGIVGGNGTGKSTLLRIVAGLQRPATGEVVMASGLRVALLPTDLKLFLFPWYTASENLALFSSAGRSTELVNGQHYAAEWASLLERESCDELMERESFGLSSGERSSLALLCVLTNPPDVFLLDELFSNTSRATSSRMIRQLRSQLDLGRTILFSSHSQEVVSELSTRILNLEHDLTVA